MASLQFLPPELLAHILHLSNEGEGAEEQQRARFSFGLIARTFVLATADATSFCVAGAVQAKALVAKLERENQWVAQEEHRARSGRTTVTRSTVRLAHISEIRHLILTVDTFTSQEVYCELLRASPNLFALELAITGTKENGISPPLEFAVRELAGLQELRLRSYYLDEIVVLR
ncbi:hypothetical protein RQP46_010787 [Phenoliferia psychrophenolica]